MEDKEGLERQAFFLWAELTIAIIVSFLAFIIFNSYTFIADIIYDKKGR